MSIRLVPGRALLLFGLFPLTACTITPAPLSDVELKDLARERLERAAQIRTPVTGVLTLESAIERAVRYNLDHRVEIYEAALRQAELGVAHADMLPSLVAGAANTNRDKVLASSSFNVITNTQNFGASTSQDTHLKTADLVLSWNILDFGLSYVRARQAADKVLIAEETRRRVVHKLVEEVRTAYWRAYAAEQLGSRMSRLEQRVQIALSRASRQASDRDTSPITAMTYRRELIEIQRIVRELQRELVSARIQLAALINEKPDAKFRLAPPRTHGLSKELSAPAAELIAKAMEKRPELREIAYRRRINAHELDAALLQLLPGINLYGGTNFDSNSFLLHDHWLSWGAKAAWNLMRIVQYPRRRELIEAQDQVLEQRDMAMCLTVMTQIHVSRARLTVMHLELETAKAYAETQTKLLDYIRAEHASNRVSEQTLLREELNAVVGLVRKHIAQANLQAAQAALAAAVGVDPAGYVAGPWQTHVVTGASAPSRT